MDYDENDFQGQNLHLAGEGSSKISPVLRPYVLPKFDFDDSLQGHLRFDSLVENEVFLGIPSSEDNQWIEDFSRGSSGIEFSSRAAESCSISRRNNVWSEATSSESVEMLLKSVGQEERALEKTITEVSEVDDEFGKLTKQMESNLNQNDKMEDSVLSQPALPPDVLPENLSGLNESAGVEHPHVECSSPTSKAELSVFESSIEVESNASSVKCGLLVCEDNGGIDRKRDASYHMEAYSSMKEPLNVKVGDIPSVSGIHIDHTSSSSFIVIANSGELNSQEGEHHVAGIFLKSTDDKPKDTSEGAMKHSSRCKESNMVDKISTAGETLTNMVTPVCVDSRLESLVEHIIERNIRNMVEPSSLSMSGDLGLAIDEGCKKDVYSADNSHCSNAEGVFFPEGSEMAKPFQSSMLEEAPVISLGDAIPNGQATRTETSACPVLEMDTVEEKEKSSGSDNQIDNINEHNIVVDNSKTGISTCPELEMDSCKEKEKGFGSDNQKVILEGQDIQVGNIKAGDSDCPELEKCNSKEREMFIGNNSHMDRVASAEAFELPGLKCKIVEGDDGTNSNFGGDIASMTVACSSSGMRIVDVFPEDHTSPLLPDGSAQLNKKNIFSVEGDVYRCDIQVGNIKAGDSDCPELGMCKAKEREKFIRNDSHKDIVASAEVSELPGLKCKIVEGDDGTNSNFGGDVASMTVACSSSGMHKVDVFPEDHTSTLLPAGSAQLNKKNIFFVEGDAYRCDQDDYLHEKGDQKFTSESSYMKCRDVGSLDSDKIDGPLCSVECIEGNVKAHVSEFDNTTGNEPASKVFVKDMKLSSFDTLSVPPLLSAAVVTCEEDIPYNHDHKPLVLGMSFAHLDKKEEMNAEIPRDASFLNLKESLEVVTEPDPVSEVSVPEAVKACLSEQPGIAVEVGQLYLVPFDLRVQEAEDDVALSFENHKETLMEINTGVANTKVAVETSAANQPSLVLGGSSEDCANATNENGGSSANLVKPNCETPTILTATEPSQSEKGKEDDIEMAMVSNDADGNVKSISLHKANDASKEDRSFTFEVSPVAGQSEGEIGKGWPPFPSVEATKILTDVDGSYLTSGGTKMDMKMVQEVPCGSPQAADRGIAHAGAKGTPERKIRRSSGKAAAKENVKKGNQVKETTPMTGKGDKSMMFVGSSGTGQPVKFEELKPYGDVERSTTQKISVMPIPTSNLLDLNPSVPPTFFQQPFTDIQQVQLRAQIFVYGSLIQEVVPDEACMSSAFGPSDGGKNIWEPAWRACTERFHGLISHTNNPKTPVQSCLGSRTADQSVKHGSLQSKVASSSVSRVSSKGTPSPVVNPIIPLSSPLWNVSTPSCDGLQSSGLQRGNVDYHQSFSSLHPYQTPAIRTVVGHSSPWLSQAPFTGSWVASTQTNAFDTNARFSMFPNTEPVKLTPVKESSVSNSSGTKHASHLTVAHSGGPSVFAGTTSLPDMKKMTVSSNQNSADPKPRKRKKVPVEGIDQIPLPAQSALASAPGDSSHLLKKAPVSEVVGQMPLLVKSRTESVFAPVISNLFSTSVAATTPASFPSTTDSSKFLSALSPSSSIDHPRREDQNVGKNVVLEGTVCTVKEAKLQAEDAAAHAAAAISHCHDVWSQLGKQTNSGLMSDIEAKLASAAVVIAAAASVAKAATAAAKVASNIALQAKLMADEVLISSESGNSTSSTAVSLSNVLNASGQATPSAILKGVDRNVNPNSIIAAAREAARKRVEAASAASKHAENLDAIVKAAELAAEAVSQAGKIVSIGNSLPLSELVDSGPDRYWKNHQEFPQQGANSNIMNIDLPITASIEGLRNAFAKQYVGGPSDTDIETKKHGSVTNDEKNSSRAQRGCRTSDLAKAIDAIPESDIGSRPSSVIVGDEYTSAPGISLENGMKEGCLVEVFKDGGNYKAAWYSANILDLKDGKAFVCYTELQSDEGSGQKKEWVTLEGDGHKAPMLRIAHPSTTMRFDGTRKRRRVAMMDHTWSVGDRVDAWMQDCWCEGIVTEKNKNDESTLTIHFPALGETLVARSWHIRPTLFWKDGQWIEWSSASGGSSSQGDTPLEKRLKLGSPAKKVNGNDNMSKGVNLVESRKHEESIQLPLSSNERAFNIGKNVRPENKLDAPRTVRTGLQKEGSRVIFGVPKPGKKQKFMDVSKHFNTGQSSMNNAKNDSVKLARYFMPHESGSRSWKNNSKVDGKEKQAAENKPKALRSGKAQSVSGGTLPKKDNLLTSVKSSPHDITKADQLAKDAISNEENDSSQQNLMESESQPLVSLLSAHKKIPPSNFKFDRLNKGKLASAGGRLVKFEVQEKSISEAVEPRRSNRRIQPTSRLLEGLQSSLTMSKIPAVPHEKSHRSQSRSTSKGNTSRG